MGSDPYGIARGLRGVVKKNAYDLVFAGTQAGDDGYAMVGPVLAGYLGWPHATLVTSIALEEKKIAVTRELEGGLEEMLTLELPAVLTIQTGINEPRYVSIMGIRKVRSKEIPVLGLGDLGRVARHLSHHGLQDVDVQVARIGVDVNLGPGIGAEAAF
jgi:electron transfer flavoprotein beta subunit